MTISLLPAMTMYLCEARVWYKGRPGGILSPFWANTIQGKTVSLRHEQLHL